MVEWLSVALYVCNLAALVDTEGDHEIQRRPGSRHACLNSRARGGQQCFALGATVGLMLGTGLTRFRPHAVGDESHAVLVRFE